MDVLERHNKRRRENYAAGLKMLAEDLAQLQKTGIPSNNQAVFYATNAMANARNQINNAIRCTLLGDKFDIDHIR